MIKRILGYTKALAIGFMALTAIEGQAQKKQKIDGVIGVVGDYVVLESDIEKRYLELSSQNIPTQNISRCELLGSLLEDKVFAHQAIQDSIVVTDAEVNSLVSQQLEAMMEQTGGSMDKIIKFYKKKDADDLKAALAEIIKESKLAEGMRDKIIDDVDITPEEIRQFYVSIPKDSLMHFGAEVEISQILFKPKISKEAEQDVIDRLKQLRQEVLDGGSFFSKAVLYTEDPGSRSNGGYYKMNKKTPFVKEFKDVAFSLKEGEISQPFKTDFGYHIIYVEKIKGQDIELRHILMSPKVSYSAELEAKERADKARTEIISGKITFAEAVAKYSDEKETKNSGGKLINPRSLETRFELTKLDPALYNKVSDLKVNEVSIPFQELDNQGNKQYKIFSVTNKIDEHLADFATDYIKIKNIALNQKKKKEIEKWLKKTVKDTYIFINPTYKDCKFDHDWLKK